MVYLDYNATTPIRGEALAAYNEASAKFGNPSSLQHGTGNAARELLEESRDRFSEILGVARTEVLFTSGATEAAFVSTLGFAAEKSKPGQLVTSPIEHKAVLEAFEFAASLTSRDLKYLKLSPTGLTDETHLEELISNETAVVSVMAVNNETGVINPLERIFEITKNANVPFISDLTQAAGKLRLKPLIENVDVGFLSAHKFYGPKGVGVLIAKREAQARMVGVLAGGGQERGIRGGTQNLPGIYSSSIALTLAESEIEKTTLHFSRLKQRFMKQLSAADESVRFFAESSFSIENTVCFSVKGIDGDMLLANLPDLEFSTGSACNSASPESSHVFNGCAESRPNASEWVRFSFGTPTTLEEVDYAAIRISRAIDRLRGLGITANAI